MRKQVNIVYFIAYSARKNMLITRIISQIYGFCLMYCGKHCLYLHAATGYDIKI